MERMFIKMNSNFEEFQCLLLVLAVKNNLEGVITLTSNRSGASFPCLELLFELEKVALGDRRLAPFRRNSTTWELLLKVSDGELNIQKAIRSLTTDCLVYSSIIRFVSTQLQEGRLVVVPGKKRSEKILKPSADVLAALDELGRVHYSMMRDDEIRS